MNPNHLLTFAVVARCKSITQAAQYLQIGQPAVSGQLKLLQGAVGEPLYERKGHQIALTPAGSGLLEYAEKMYCDFNQAIDYVRCLKDVNAGSLRIGATSTLASFYLPRFVVQLQAEHSGVQVYMETEDTREIVAKMHDYDLGFVEGTVEREELPINYQVIPWQTDEIVLILAEDHPLAVQYPQAAPLTVFAEYQVIWREPGSGARQVVQKALAEAGISAPINIEVTGVTGVKEAVRAGMGIGFSSSQALRHESEGLVARRINPPQGLPWHLNLIAPNPAMRSRVAKAFLALCLSE
ncbi:LysR family transcriptional regulator [Methylomarinum sp. Ch1-1]|uniref:LysR family transcriptional regulator n=1 Tax=Methylomarinum roseum TaxID=3067653 RepID=A0AAU7NRK6_9GAMM|nr:LysR family transcriptional regulator [Methylomarinum sp. Ch1-1]MDP4520451.1 LysR family transcriptional regulator [Methylomarinum sp. Ch1-1]